MFTVLLLGFLPVIVLLTVVPCKTFEVLDGLWAPVVAWVGSILRGHVAGAAGAENGTPYRVVLLGDSLVNRPMNHFNLAGRLQALLPEVPLDVTNCGFDGTGVEWMRNNSLPKCALPARPDAVILFWHTDASDVDEAAMDDDTVATLHRRYRLNLAAVLDTLLKTGAHVAVTSTGVLGETKTALFQPHTARFHKKWPILNQYCAMNRAAAAEFSVPYVDLRRALMDYIPCTQLAYAWCVTLEGEHLNSRGVAIQARMFADTLRPWATAWAAARAGGPRVKASSITTAAAAAAALIKRGHTRRAAKEVAA